jgi:hypothetical protein
MWAAVVERRDNPGTARSAMIVRHAAALLISLGLVTTAEGPAAAQTTEVVGPMTIVMPSGWTRRAADPVMFFVAEASASGQEVSQVFVNAVNQPGATQAAVHGVLWNQMLQSESRPKRLSNGSFGRFTWSQMEVSDAGGQKIAYYRFYTTKADASHVAVLFVATSANMFNKQLAAVEGALANAKFSTTEPAVSPAPRANSVPGFPAKDIPIVESHIHVEIRPGSLTSNVLNDHILFFQNGIVVRQGFISAPRDCYATIQTADLATLPFNYGRWRENKPAGEVSIAWQEGPPWTLKRDGDRLSLAGKKLLKFQPLDGLKLDGTFVHRSLTGANIVLALRRDGNFETAGLLEEMTCPGGDPRPALSGSGTYEVRKWTLILRFASGKVTLLPISVTSEQDLQQVSKFSLRSAYDFVKAR